MPNHATVEHAQETSRRIKRSEEGEKLSAQLVAKSRDQLERSRARLGALPRTPLMSRHYGALEHPPPGAESAR